MGEAAATWADLVIVTDDNPRDENPASIRAAVMAGAEQVGAGAEVMEIADRAEAVRVAVRRALPDGSIAILGKGHERTQEVAGILHPFDDRTALADALRQAFPNARGTSR
jgi:UDP-N-acetylmuramoyl-L-alanyl-D-glutamate--2,6-diaminopimelate ligase